jgi:hypothetical protein
MENQAFRGQSNESRELSAVGFKGLNETNAAPLASKQVEPIKITYFRHKDGF